MESAWIALAGGAAAFAHCLGMCGGFVLHVSLGTARIGAAGAAMRQALWHIGRITSYAFIGALAGWAGAASSLTRWPLWQQGLAVAAGAAMIAAGLVMLGLRRRQGGQSGPGAGILASLMRLLPAEPTAGSALALGLVCGLLPCPATLAFAALAASTRSVAGGIVIMGAMGVGTLWSLALLGAGARIAGSRVRKYAAPVGGALLIVLGAVTALRATTLYRYLPGCCVDRPAATAPAAATGQTCPHCPAAAASQP